MIFSLNIYFLYNAINASIFFEKIYNLIISIISIISFVLTIYSTHTIITKLKKSRFCTTKKVKEGSKIIAKKIDNFCPNKIIYFGDHTRKLYNDHIKDNLKGDYEIIYFNIIDKNTFNYRLVPTIFSKKFAIEVGTHSFKNTDRIILLDDIIITGNTINTIKQYLTSLGIKEENIYSCSLVVDKNGYCTHGEPEYYYIKEDIEDSYKFSWRK